MCSRAADSFYSNSIYSCCIKTKSPLINTRIKFEPKLCINWGLDYTNVQGRDRMTTDEDATADLGHVLTDISDALLSGPPACTGQDTRDTPDHDGDISADTPRSVGHCRPGDRHCMFPQYCSLTPLSPADCPPSHLQQCRPPVSRHHHP